MIRYTLKCAEGHEFDSWFQSADAFEALETRGLVSCAVCGGSGVSKAMMAPGVAKRGEATIAPPTPSHALEKPSLTTPATPMEVALAKLRAHIEAHSTYVGGNFAREARAIHLGEAPERMIHGEAMPEEAKALIEDGVPIAPLPIIPKDRST
ncbi:MAG: DUF1178 domain-containing protein [Rhodobacteraceae bacterium CG17_big_fil_post_rev_8_21_14_2_50_65_11]|nr:MAG: DUF1178 domain-containing protein [Rhodobacteraceae bacterium CG17_big_fil_post_rev_8_21_14_2_50_65_11]